MSALRLPKPYATTALRALLVDDSVAVRTRLAELILRTGRVAEVVQAGSLEQARGILNREPFDAAVLDLELPDGSGLELIAELKERSPTMLLIMLTNYPSAEFRSRCMALGADHFLDKTLEFQRITELLAQTSARAADESPQREMERLLSLLDYQILDTPTEQAFDDLTALAAQICGTPMALISLIDADRQWFKSHHGTTLEATSRATSFCAIAIQSEGLFMVGDTQSDARFARNPLVREDPHIRFYAGMPLTVGNGHKLGALCVIDQVPRTLSAEQIAALKLLTRQTVSLLEYRRLTVALQSANEARTIVERKLEVLATRDDLTGLDNRLAFRHGLERALSLAGRQRARLACLYLDLDDFKRVNDSLGHPVGDELLVAAARRLRSMVRDSDIVARLGGDEFGLVLANVGRIEDVATLAGAMVEKMIAPYVLKDHVVHVGCSVGISLSPEDSSAVDTLIQQADTALYHAKYSGKGAFKFFAPEMNRRVTTRQRLGEDLRGAVANEAFTLVYQPQIDCTSGAIVGAEALLRWPRPDAEAISPVEFLTVAEELQIYQGIGTWVLSNACAQFAAWRDSGITLGRMAVNINASQLQQGFVGVVLQTLASYAMLAGQLELEITESQLLRDFEQAATVIAELRAHGVRIALDDFGTGYSSLTVLKEVTVDRLKIDQRFVRDIALGGSDAAIVSAIVALAHSLALRVTAEGVESAPQLEALRTVGCEDFQGYIASAALAPQEFARYWRATSPAVAQ